MLVLSRKQSEEIRVGENITIRILGIQGNTVRLGFEAPREIDIVRGELVEFSASERVNTEERSDELYSFESDRSEQRHGKGNNRSPDSVNEARLKSYSARSRNEKLPLAAMLPSKR